MSEMKILELISDDKIFNFIHKFRELEREYKEMKKVFDKQIKAKLRTIAGKDGIIVGNDVFKITVTPSEPTKKLIPIAKARALPQEIKDLILVDSMTSQRVLIKEVEDEKDVEAYS